MIGVWCITFGLPLMRLHLFSAHSVAFFMGGLEVAGAAERVLYDAHNFAVRCCSAFLDAVLSPVSIGDVRV